MWREDAALFAIAWTGDAIAEVRVVDERLGYPWALDSLKALLALQDPVDEAAQRRREIMRLVR